jgi:ABC-type glycerol-3-phosphate transport system substrate-binding protein
MLVVFALSVSVPAFAQGANITVWFTGDDTGAAIMQEVAQGWAEQTGNTVTVSAVSWGDAYATALAAVADGSGADIIVGGMSWGISLGQLGGMVDLGAQFPDQVAQIEEQSTPAFWDSIVTPAGQVFYLPYNLDLMLMYYVPGVFEAAGVSVPTTWEEMAVAAEAGLMGGQSWGNASWVGFQSVLGQAGASWYADDCSAAAINSDEGLLALEQFAAQYDSLGFPAEQVPVSDAFATGAHAYVIDGEWTATSINAAHPELEGQWDVTTLPAGPGGFTAFLGGKGMGILSYSPNVEAAMDLMMYLSTPEAAQMTAELNLANANSIFVPPQPANYQFVLGGENVAAAIAAQLEDVSAPPNCPGWEESNADVELVLQSVVFEEMDFQDALDELEAILNQGIADFS